MCRSGIRSRVWRDTGDSRSSGIYCFNADCSQSWYYPVTSCRFTDAALDDDGSLYVADIANGKLYRFQD
jgi:outer membrane protein assembly factor BamB